MALPRDLDARRFYRVAYQRLEDGGLVLRLLDRPKTAMYLTGYAIECILKALLVAWTPSRRRRSVMSQFRGSRGHDLLWLRQAVSALIGEIPPNVRRELAYVGSWSTDMRYEADMGDREDAERFLLAAEIILQWADGRI